jgi:hypothetical protein
VEQRQQVSTAVQVLVAQRHSRAHLAALGWCRQAAPWGSMLR